MRLSWNDGFAGMTIAQARRVRRMRVDDEDTWRGVAYECAREWGGDWGSNQFAGVAICKRAAEILGENHMAEPWN